VTLEFLVNFGYNPQFNSFPIHPSNPVNLDGFAIKLTTAIGSLNSVFVYPYTFLLLFSESV